MAIACEIPIRQPQTGAHGPRVRTGTRRSSHLISPLRIAVVLLAFLAPFVPLTYKVMNEIAIQDPLAQPDAVLIRAFVISIFSLVLCCNVVRWMNLLEARR